MRQHLTIFANFICKFGDGNLGDLLQEVVLPAFTDDTLVREARGSSFHLLDVSLIPSLVTDRPEPAIAGQFIRDTVLRRTQVYYPGHGLVPDEAFLETSPSSFFVLLLRDHRLIYFAETPDAPDLSTFETTMSRFLNIKYYQYIDHIYIAERHNKNIVTKKYLRDQIPPPKLTVVPLTNKDELENFIKRYKRLQRVDITVHRKNDEISTASLIANADAFNEALKGQRTKISTSDSSGLDKDGTVKALQAVTDGANETIRLFGEDEAGDRLVGDNDAFSVRVMIDHLVGELTTKATILYGKLLELVNRGVINRPATDDAAAAAIAEALDVNVGN